MVVFCCHYIVEVICSPNLSIVYILSALPLFHTADKGGSQFLDMYIFSTSFRSSCAQSSQLMFSPKALSFQLLSLKGTVSPLSSNAVNNKKELCVHVKTNRKGMKLEQNNREHVT